MKEHFIFFFEKHLDTFRAEIAAYTQEDQLWQMTPGISNSAGNLCYHLIGNLNHFIGVAIGKTNYQRNRPLEFSIKDIPQADLLEMIDETKAIVLRILNQIEDYDAPYPITFFGREGSINHFLIKLLTHLNYHVGQINYHRRILTGK